VATGIESRVKELGLVLPPLPEPGGNYLPARTVGNMVYLAGVISMLDGKVIAGTVGAGRTLDDGYAAARACALTQLAVLKRHLMSLDQVKAIVAAHGSLLP
jgi:enamine deaminase RidA (YjgF/YER057c/UK114 family)